MKQALETPLLASEQIRPTSWQVTQCKAKFYVCQEQISFQIVRTYVHFFLLVKLGFFFSHYYSKYRASTQFFFFTPIMVELVVMREENSRIEVRSDSLFILYTKRKCCTAASIIYAIVTCNHKRWQIDKSNAKFCRYGICCIASLALYE